MKPKDDLISRKAAINVIDKRLNELCGKHLNGKTFQNRTFKDGIYDGYYRIRSDIQIIPSAQPETHEKRTETHACDCISRKAAIDAMKSISDSICGQQAIDALCELPSAQPVAKDINVPVKDCISRQAAIGEIKALYEWHDTVTEDRTIDHLKRLPSAQPELPEWAQKVEEYRKSAPSFVRNQLVWALYQTWKEYDGRLVHQRGKENR